MSDSFFFPSINDHLYRLKYCLLIFRKYVYFTSRFCFGAANRTLIPWTGAFETFAGFRFFHYSLCYYDWELKTLYLHNTFSYKDKLQWKCLPCSRATAKRRSPARGLEGAMIEQFVIRPSRYALLQLFVYYYIWNVMLHWINRIILKIGALRDQCCIEIKSWCLGGFRNVYG